MSKTESVNPVEGSGCSLRTIAFGFVALVVGSCLIIPRGGHPRSHAYRSQCRSHLGEIMIALYNYHDQYRSFPPAYIADANGKPMHSWRVLILPFLEQYNLQQQEDLQRLYKKYRFDEPWDGPHNRQLHTIPVATYVCLASHDRRQNKLPTTTTYLAVVGTETLWPGSTCVRIGQVKDGAANTIAVVENIDSGIHCLEPRDLSFDEMSFQINDPERPSISSAHDSGTEIDSAGAQVAMSDGSVRFAPNSMEPTKVRAFLTINSGEELRDF